MVDLIDAETARREAESRELQARADAFAGRLELASVNEPINCGDVLVRAGDGIIADSDGIVVVPQAEADEIAKRAWLVQDKDRRMRRAFYENLGMPYDATVELEERPW